MRWMPGLELGDVVWLCLVLIVWRSFGTSSCIMSLLAEDRIWKQGAEVWEVNMKWRTFAVFTHFGTGSKRNATYSKTADWTKWRPCSLVTQLSKAPQLSSWWNVAKPWNFLEVLPQLSQESFGQGNGQTEISPLQKLVELMNCQAMVRMLCQVDVGWRHALYFTTCKLQLVAVIIFEGQLKSATRTLAVVGRWSLNWLC